ncbi:DNA repair protein [Tuber borchii]|uniref:DNA repair protein n=1 Tax=Tuber borchii TaxID=42251 RepID=A0A2T7A698_TUBBO|nr:DNA repair protein [Tuber borchii]
MSDPEDPPQQTLTPQERKIASLRKSITSLESQIEQIESEHAEVLARLKDKDAEKTVKGHIRLLHEFNEVRDVGLGLIGMVSENRGTRVQNVMREFGVSPSD